MARVQFLAGAGIFLFATVCKLALENTQPPIHWIPGVIWLGAKLTTHLHLGVSVNANTLIRG